MSSITNSFEKLSDNFSLITVDILHDEDGEPFVRISIATLTFTPCINEIMLKMNEMEKLFPFIESQEDVTFGMERIVSFVRTNNPDLYQIKLVQRDGQVQQIVLSADKLDALCKEKGMILNLTHELQQLQSQNTSSLPSHPMLTKKSENLIDISPKITYRRLTKSRSKPYQKNYSKHYDIINKESILDFIESDKAKNVSESKSSQILTCEYCDKLFDRLFNYKRHIDSHLGIKRFICEECEAKFSSKVNLEKHLMKRHLSIRLFD